MTAAGAGQGPGWRQLRTSARARLSLALVLVSLLGVGGLDWWSAHEYSVIALYALPVALATRRLGDGMGLCVALLCTLLWVLADVGSGHVPRHAWYVPLNAANRLVYFLVVCRLVHLLNQRERVQAQRLQALTGPLCVCNACQKVSAGDGYWRTPLDHLIEFGAPELRGKVCPDCARRHQAQEGGIGPVLRTTSPSI